MQSYLALAMHKPKVLVLCHLMKISSDLLTSKCRGMTLDIKFHLLKEYIYQKSGFLSQGTSTAKVGIAITVTILWLTRRPGSVTPIYIENILRNFFFFCSGIHVDKDVCLARCWEHCCQNLFKVRIEELY